MMFCCLVTTSWIFIVYSNKKPVTALSGMAKNVENICKARVDSTIILDLPILLFCAVVSATLFAERVS